MKIGLNLLPFVSGVGGSWRYVENLIRALAEHAEECEFHCFVTSASACLVPDRPNFVSYHIGLQARRRSLRIAFENLILPGKAEFRSLDCVHHLFGTMPRSGRIPAVVTVFDLMVFDRPSDFPPVKRAYRRRMLEYAGRNAAVVAPMSHSTAASLVRVLHVPADRIVVIPPVIPDSLRRREPRDVHAFRQLHGLPEKFWLYVAVPYRHKNFDRLLAAMALNRNADARAWPLVIRADATPELERQIEAASLRSQIEFLPWIANDDMSTLYSAATALIFPSLYEGGGLPVIEAMACGCPVVASDLPTTREFAGPAALTFDPSSIPDIARAMREFEASPELRERLAARGAERASLYRAEHSAAASLSAYSQAIARHGADTHSAG